MDLLSITAIINKEGYTARVVEVPKGSAMKFAIEMGEGNIKALIYKDNINASGTDEEIAKVIIETYRKVPKPNLNLDNVFDLDYIKENVFVAVRRPLEDDAFTKNFLDMQLVLKVRLTEGATYTVKVPMAEKLGIGEDMFEDAIHNMTFKFQSMADALGIPEEFMDSVQIWVLSTENKLFGAAAMADAELLSTIAENLDSDLIVIPSSTHEVLIYKLEKDSDMDQISKMVREVNSQEVADYEQISDHAYIFHRNLKSFTW